jgi:hypothetical protein
MHLRLLATRLPHARAMSSPACGRRPAAGCQVLTDNPLADFVELPDEYKADLRYSALLCGVIRGALEMVRRRAGAGAGRPGTEWRCARTPACSPSCAPFGPFRRRAPSAGRRCDLRWQSCSPAWRAADVAPRPCAPPMQVNMDVDARFVQDMLRGDEVYEIRLKLKEHRAEAFPFKDDD